MTKYHWMLRCMAVVVSTVTSCPKSPKNTDDTTPPTVSWHVLNKLTNVSTDESATATKSAKRGDTYLITAKAHDADGIKWIGMNQSFSGQMVWTCFSTGGGENVGQNKTADFVGTEQAVTGDSSGNVLQEIFLMQQIDLDMPCQDSSWTFGSGHVTLTVIGQNWGEQTASGKLTINVTQ